MSGFSLESFVYAEGNALLMCLYESIRLGEGDRCTDWTGGPGTCASTANDECILAGRMVYVQTKSLRIRSAQPTSIPTVGDSVLGWCDNAECVPEG